MFKCTISQALFQLCTGLLISCYNKDMRFWLFLFFLTNPLACYAQVHDHVQIAQRNMPAVVAVNVLSADGSTSTGTGFIITSNGFLITNYHVIEKSLYTNITFNNGVISGEALPIANSKQTDLSLLKIEAQHLPTVTLAKDDNAFPGQTITVIGNPRRLQNTVTSGIISQLRQQKNGILWHQISAPISPSSSGSPVFNSQGEVISVAFSMILAPSSIRNVVIKVFICSIDVPKNPKTTLIVLSTQVQKIVHHVVIVVQIVVRNVVRPCMNNSLFPVSNPVIISITDTIALNSASKSSLIVSKAA